jgi:uncharacterized membrane protein
MDSRAKLLGHPLHQMLVPLPFGLLAMAVVFDLFGLTLGGTWSQISYYMIGAGVITGLLAAPFGFVDFLAIPSGTRAKRVGAVHGIGNLFVVVFFALSWSQRGLDPVTPPAFALVLSFLGGALALFTGWLGGELVDRLSVGVDDGANINAPSSLKSRRVA